MSARDGAAPPRASDFDLAGYLPYLVNRTGAAIAGAFSAEIERLGVTLPVWRVMAALLPARPMSQIDLAARVAIDPSTLSRVLKSAEAKGLVKRDRVAADQRVVEVALTAKGRFLARRIVPLARRYEALATAGLTADEKRILRDLLVRLYANVAALVPSEEGGR